MSTIRPRLEYEALVWSTQKAYQKTLKNSTRSNKNGTKNESPDILRKIRKVMPANTVREKRKNEFDHSVKGDEGNGNNL